MLLHHSRCAGAERGAFALPGTKRKYERSLEFRFNHLALDLRIHVEEGRVEGSATLEIERVAKTARELCLDAVDFAIDKIELDGGRGFSKAPYDYDDRQLRVRVGARFKRGRVRVTYQAAPRRGLYFLAPDAKVKDRPVQVWSQCQDEDARHWFPCHDKPHVKTSAEFRYTVPADMQVLANGERVYETKPSRGGKKKRGSQSWTRFHYSISEPLPSYLVTLVVGKFDVVEDRPAVLPSGKSVPVTYWLPKRKREQGMRAFHRTPHMIEHFSSLLGVEYPFNRYSQVVVSDFIFGGMENTTATTMYEHVLLDERAAVDIDSHDLVAHELAHQWFGDWVTCRDWPEAWLNEGFATYFEHVEREDRLGRDEYLCALERDLAAYSGEAAARYSRPIVSRDYDEPIDLFDRHLYEKGSLVLHLLRSELGDEVFWSGVQRYLKTRGRSTATTHDLKSALESESGSSLDRFFEEWIYRAGHPRVSVKVSWANKLLTVKLAQTQKAPPFALTVELEIKPKSGPTILHPVTLDDKNAGVTLNYPQRPAYVAVDPNLRVLGELNVEAPVEMLRRQLQEAQTARGRRQAARLLAKKHDFKTSNILDQVLRDENVAWMVRVQVARTLGRQVSEAARKSLLSSVRTEEPRVRAAVAEALGNYDDDSTAKALGTILKNEKSYLVTAAATLALGKTRTTVAEKQVERRLDEASWGDVVASSALDGLAELGNPAKVDLVKRRTVYGNPTRARRSAVLALAKLDKSEQTTKELQRLLTDAHPHFRMSVVAALEEVGDKRASSVLRRQLSRETDGRVVRRIREALHKLRLDQPSREVAEKMTRLEKELAETKAQLATLEARVAKR